MAAGVAVGTLGAASRTASASTTADTAGAASAGAAQAATPAQLTAATVNSGDSPAGFWYGTDSGYIGTPYTAPYDTPGPITGTYGGYIGMIGNWAHWQGCGGTIAWSPTNAKLASINYTTYHAGIGVGGYWFMAGPGVDPHYNGTAAEATRWGQAQAARTLADLPGESSKVNYPVIFMDIELPGHAPNYTPASDNGWNSIYTSKCSGKVKQLHIPAAVDRADVNGFANYITSHSSYKVGAYSAPSIWTSIFGTGSASKIPNTYEWTYNADTSKLSPKPAGWCLSGTKTCAQFFGGQTSSSSHAVMWQWSGGGGTRNGYGDFDQIDANRTP